MFQHSINSIINESENGPNLLLYHPIPHIFCFNYSEKTYNLYHRSSRHHSIYCYQIANSHEYHSICVCHCISVAWSTCNRHRLCVDFLRQWKITSMIPIKITRNRITFQIFSPVLGKLATKNRHTFWMKLFLVDDALFSHEFHFTSLCWIAIFSCGVNRNEKESDYIL